MNSSFRKKIQQMRNSKTKRSSRLQLDISQAKKDFYNYRPSVLKMMGA